MSARQPAPAASASLPLLFPEGEARSASAVRQAHVEAVLGIMLYIQDHLDESLTLERLADHGGVSPSTLSHVFPGVVGETL